DGEAHLLDGLRIQGGLLEFREPSRGLHAQYVEEELGQLLPALQGKALLIALDRSLEVSHCRELLDLGVDRGFGLPEEFPAPVPLVPIEEQPIAVHLNVQS